MGSHYGRIVGFLVNSILNNVPRPLHRGAGLLFKLMFAFL